MVMLAMMVMMLMMLMMLMLYIQRPWIPTNTTQSKTVISFFGTKEMPRLCYQRFICIILKDYFTWQFSFYILVYMYMYMYSMEHVYILHGVYIYYIYAYD